MFFSEGLMCARHCWFYFIWVIWKTFEWFKGWLSASCSSLFALQASLESGWYGLHPLLNEWPSKEARHNGVFIGICCGIDSWNGCVCFSWSMKLQVDLSESLSHVFVLLWILQQTFLNLFASKLCSARVLSAYQMRRVDSWGIESNSWWYANIFTL